jgi:hypothetical protein
LRIPWKSEAVPAQPELGEPEVECLIESLLAATVWSSWGAIGGSVYAHDRELRDSYHRDNPDHYRDNVEH